MQFCRYVLAHFLQSVGVILRISVSFRPGQLFYERGEALPPVVARARFYAQIVVQIAQMNRGRLAERHFRRDFAVTVASPLSVLF